MSHINSFFTAVFYLRISQKVRINEILRIMIHPDN